MKSNIIVLDFGLNGKERRFEVKKEKKKERKNFFKDGNNKERKYEIVF